jgi:hypothetical protein
MCDQDSNHVQDCPAFVCCVTPESALWTLHCILHFWAMIIRTGPACLFAGPLTEPIDPRGSTLAQLLYLFIATSAQLSSRCDVWLALKASRSNSASCLACSFREWLLVPDCKQQPSTPSHASLRQIESYMDRLLLALPRETTAPLHASRLRLFH